MYVLKLREVGGKKLYFGFSADLRKRLKEHLAGQVRSTKERNPELIYYEAYQDKYLALQREKGLKSSGSVYNALLKRLGYK